ncbi:MAG: polysaccharide pyruvyl transferase family protein [Ignavibacteriae bacterium]|nr:polysaccharide pyruvyl transferase family protein [Ignavibacteriota bacterium]
MKFFKKINYFPNKYYCERELKENYIIHHYSPHTFNAGDHFVIQSIRNHVKNLLPEAVFVPKAIANNRGWGKPIGLRKENILFSNTHADAVIVGGSDQYNNWSPRISRKEINFLKPPLFLIGLGVSSKDLNSEPYIKNKEFNEDIIATNNKAELSSVRDDITYNFLKGLGFDKAINTGCPALHLFNNDFSINDSRKVLLTFPFPMVNNDSQNFKYKVLVDVVKKLLTYLHSKKLEPIIVCHDDRDVKVAQYEFSNEKIFFSNYHQDYFELYKNSLLVVGSRLHATILTSGMGIPNININLDLRGKAFTESFELTDWNLDYTDKHIFDKLVERVEKVLSGSLSMFVKFSIKKKEKRQVFNKFIEDTVKIIKTPIMM